MNADGTLLTGQGIANVGGWIVVPGHSMPKALSNGTVSTAAFASSADGMLVGGSVGNSFDRTGFLWTPARGVEPLLVALRRLLGAALPDSVTTSALGSVMTISADGSTIGGWGWTLPPSPKLGPHSWLARLEDLGSRSSLEAVNEPSVALQTHADTDVQASDESSGIIAPQTPGLGALMLCAVVGSFIGGAFVMSAYAWQRRHVGIALKPLLG